MSPYVSTWCLNECTLVVARLRLTSAFCWTSRGDSAFIRIRARVITGSRSNSTCQSRICPVRGTHGWNVTLTLFTYRTTAICPKLSRLLRTFVVQHKYFDLRFCGKDRPTETLQSAGNEVLILFRAKNNRAHISEMIGFNIQYQAGKIPLAACVRDDVMESVSAAWIVFTLVRMFLRLFCFRFLSLNTNSLPSALHKSFALRNINTNVLCSYIPLSINVSAAVMG